LEPGARTRNHRIDRPVKTAFLPQKMRIREIMIPLNTLKIN
jgi:hypothetical protein